MFIYGDLRRIPEDQQTDEMCLFAVKRDWRNIEYVKNQTKEICLAAVEKDWNALKFVKNQTEDVCLVAVKMDWRALRHVKNQTEEICIAAILSESCKYYILEALSDIKYKTDKIFLSAIKNCNIQHVELIFSKIKKQTPELCLAALIRDGDIIKYIKEQTEEMCVIAIESRNTNIRYVKNQTDNLCLKALRSNGNAEEVLLYINNKNDDMLSKALLEYYDSSFYKSNAIDIFKQIKNKTPEICLVAVKIDGRCLKFIKNQTEEICLAAVYNYPQGIKYVKNQTEEICLTAIKNTRLVDTERVFTSIKNPTNEMCMIALNNDHNVYQLIKNPTEQMGLLAVTAKGSNLYYVKNQTEEICVAAIKNNYKSFQYVKNLSPAILREVLSREEGFDFNYRDVSDDVLICLSKTNLKHFVSDIKKINDGLLKSFIYKKGMARPNEVLLVKALVDKIKSGHWTATENFLDGFIKNPQKYYAEVLSELDASYVINLKNKIPEVFESNIDLMAIYEKMLLEDNININNIADKSKSKRIF